MSTSDLRYPAASGGDNSAPPIVTPHYASSLPNPPSDPPNGRQTRCATGIRFLTTIHGILNIIILVAIVCVIISAGVADNQNGKDADDSEHSSNAKVSAFHTRNAVLVFAVFGLILILLDTILHVTKLIYRLPPIFDTIFIIVMLVLAVIFFILGCCAAAWEKKMRDTLEDLGVLKRKGAAASAAFFLFVAMIAMIIDFVLRLFNRAPSQSYNP
ncbi:hypothetical protein I4U23_002192 [Adineta vaga]|nr:hypothetical protein I4U23_002192 [Adineta vaga]